VILVDSSVWIDHLRSGDTALVSLRRRDLPGATIWTRDKRLHAVCWRLALAAPIAL
jgi:predicted nucleic acid-binding protein